jgi:hypothetical protein
VKHNAWYYVTWLDAASSDDDDPKSAGMCIRQNTWRYLRTETHKWRGKRIKFYVFAYGLDEDDDTNAGWMALPDAMLLEVEELKPKTRMKEEERHGKV